MNIYSTITIGGIIGIFLHAWVSILKIAKNSDKYSARDVLLQYWKVDKLSLITSILCFSVLLWLSSEYVNLNDVLESKNVALSEKIAHFRIGYLLKTSSIIAGFFADYVVYGFLGKAKKTLDTQIGEVVENHQQTP